MRSELKLKTFEAERLALQFEQNLAGARRDEVTNSAAREKVEVLKSEYYELQAHAPTPHIILHSYPPPRSASPSGDNLALPPA